MLNQKKDELEKQLEEERKRFIEMERKAVGKDISTTSAFVGGLFLASFFFSLVGGGGEPLNRVVLLLFLIMPFPVLLVINMWNQKYFFDSAGIKLLLIILSIIEIIIAFAMAYEINGPGTQFPRIGNYTLSIIVYVIVDLGIIALLLTISYFFIQSNEKPIK